MLIGIAKEPRRGCRPGRRFSVSIRVLIGIAKEPAHRDILLDGELVSIRVLIGIAKERVNRAGRVVSQVGFNPCVDRNS